MDEFFTLFDQLLQMLQMVLSGAKPFPTPMGGPTLPNPAIADIIQIITKYKQMTQ